MLLKLKWMFGQRVVSQNFVRKIIIILLALFVAMITTSFGFGIRQAQGMRGPAIGTQRAGYEKEGDEKVNQNQRGDVRTRQAQEASCRLPVAGTPLSTGDQKTFSELKDVLEPRVVALEGEIESLRADRENLSERINALEARLVQQRSSLEHEIWVNDIQSQVIAMGVSGQGENITRYVQVRRVQRLRDLEGIQGTLVERRGQLEAIASTDAEGDEPRLTAIREEQAALEAEIGDLEAQEARIQLDIDYLNENFEVEVAEPETENGESETPTSEVPAPVITPAASWEEMQQFLQVAYTQFLRQNTDGSLAPASNSLAELIDYEE